MVYINLSRDRRFHGFTLKELLVVIGIIVLLASLLLPTVMRANKLARRTKAGRDLQILQLGLDEYKNQHGSYPSADDEYLADNNMDGAMTMYKALSGKVPTLTGNFNSNHQLDDNLDPRSHRAFGALIKLDSFKTIQVTLNGPTGQEIYTSFAIDGMPILYFPAHLPLPEIRNGVQYIGSQTGHVPVPGRVVLPMYNLADAGAYSRPPNPLGLSFEDMSRIMTGDFNTINGFLQTGDQPAYTGPFLLWTTGEDGAFGLGSDQKTDDITNFTMPVQFLRK
jgi:prepilin-type N-terminal cleavage/methylation domain-containing protein